MNSDNVQDVEIPKGYLNWAGEESVRIAERKRCEYDAALEMAKSAYQYLSKRWLEIDNDRRLTAEEFEQVLYAFYTAGYAGGHQGGDVHEGFEAACIQFKLKSK